MDVSTTTTPPTPAPRQKSTLKRWNEARLKLAETQRGTIAEWTVTILLLLFATTSLVQAFVIPTGSMEDSLLIGDHLLVDKLTYSPKGPVSQYLLPYQDVKRGDIIVRVGDTEIRTPGEAKKAIDAARTSGRSTILLRIRRADNFLFVALKANPEKKQEKKQDKKPAGE